MDPRIQEAAAIIQKLMEVLAMAVEEIQNLKNTQQKPNTSQGEMNKQASVVDTSAIARELGMKPTDVPEFLKFASIDQFLSLRDSILANNTDGDIVKVSSIGFGDEEIDLNSAINNIANS